MGVQGGTRLATAQGRIKVPGSEAESTFIQVAGFTRKQSVILSIVYLKIFLFGDSFLDQDYLDNFIIFFAVFSIGIVANLQKYQQWQKKMNKFAKNYKNVRFIDSDNTCWCLT
jgi:hypothetical protein